jgi:hypothetical protein
MVNPQELEICRRRGHKAEPRAEWVQCKWCRMWLREKRIIEEREDEPPLEELDPVIRIQRNIKRLRSGADERPS